MKKRVILFLLVITVMFMFGCVDKLSEEELAEELDNLTEDELNYVLAEDGENFAGEASRSKQITKLNSLRRNVKPRIVGCSDSDGGRNYEESGSVTLLGYPGGEITKADQCNSLYKLREYVCLEGRYKGSNTFDCKSLGEDYGCKAGACAKITCPSGSYLSEGTCVDLPLAACEELRTFNLFVLFDDNSYEASDETILEYFDLASDLLFERTCTVFDVIHIERVNIPSEEEIDSTINTFITENEDLVLESNGFVIFAHEESSLRKGGHVLDYVPSHLGVTDYCNSFSSPLFQSNWLYGSIVDYTHRYAACGYDKDYYVETGEWVHISDVSLADGSCGNRAGVPCVLNNGYYMCENFLDTYYASDSRIKIPISIVHEIMHFFGVLNTMSQDHGVGSEECNELYRGNLDDFVCEYSFNQCFFNMCRYTYENFIESSYHCDSVTEFLPDLFIEEIILQDENLVIRGCNRITPILEEITYSYTVSRGEEILIEETEIKSGIGPACDARTVTIPLSTLAVTSGDVLDVTFTWDPDNLIEEGIEENNMVSENLVIP